MPKTPTLLLSASLLATLCLSSPPAARARTSCFDVSGPSAAPDSSSRRVTLASAVKPVAGCEYALSPEGPFRAVQPGDGAPADFASLVLALWGRGAPDKPQSVFARRAGKATEGLQSVFLAGCSDYLLAGRAFSMRVPMDTQRPEVTRLPARGGQDCGADGLSLRFAALGASTGGKLPPLVRGGPWDASLPTEGQSLTLEPGSFGVYATRGGADVGMLIGRIETGSSLTPLRAALRAVAAGTPPPEPWLRAGFAAGQLHLEPTSDALRQGELWLELRGAAASGLAWLESSTGRHPLQLGPGGNALHVPAEHVAEQMRRRYGDGATQVVPSIADWRAIQADLQLCLADHYSGKGVAAASAKATCVALAGLRAPLSVRGGAAVASGQVCLKRRTWIMGAETTEPGPELGESCVPLATGSEGESEPPLPLAMVGDQLTLSSSSSAGLFLCHDNTCEAMPEPGTWVKLDRPGLLAIRSGNTPADARARHGLTLLRVGVIDPRTQWHPVGLYDDTRHVKATKEPAPADRWSTLAHDEADVFSYVRSRDDLEFRFSASTALAGALDGQADPTQHVRAQLPLVTRRVARFDAPPGSGLVVLATRAPVCPNAPAGALPDGELVDPDRLVTDQRFYLHLARYRGESEPYRCMATAGMRVSESLSVAVSERVRAGVLGDVQAVVFMNRPAALGAALPLGYVQLRLPYGLGLDASASLTSALAFEDAALTRAGLGFSGTVFWGPPELAPRLLSAGVMLHLASGTHRSKPAASLIAALNLSTLFDLAGGR
jgi:hypothetical protein